MVRKAVLVRRAGLELGEGGLLDTVRQGERGSRGAVCSAFVSRPRRGGRRLTGEATAPLSRQMIDGLRGVTAPVGPSGRCPRPPMAAP